MSRICVIVPVFNVEAYLVRCLDSLLKQTYKDFELVLVDDGAIDKSGAICDDYAAVDKRINVIHQTNRGLSAARNAGLDWAFAKNEIEWIVFVDSDDWVHPYYLEALRSAVEKHNIAIANCGFLETCGEDLQEITELTSYVCPVDIYYIRSRANANTNANINATVSWGKIYKKECFQNIRFPVGRLHEDEFVTYRILFSQERIAVIDTPLYAYFQNDTGIMRRKWNPKRLDVLDALEEQVAFFVKRNYLDIARMRFNNYINNNLKGQELTVQCETINDDERRIIIKGLKKSLRQMLIRYRKYRWAAPWRRGNDLWAYDSAYMSVHIVHSIWRGVKRILPARWKASIRVSIDKLKRTRRYISAIKGCDAILLQTPLHSNLGDHAIALAEIEALKRLGIACADTPWISGTEKWCAAVTPRTKTILIHGGGFLGTLWPNEEETFRTELTAFIKHRVIVFPQTAFFDMDTDRGEIVFQESKARYTAHPDLTVFLREQVSYDFMRQNMPDVRAALVPDMVMAMTAEMKPCQREGVLLCLRKDKERTLTDEQKVYLEELGRHTDTVLDNPVALDKRESAVREKLQEFASAEIVITDRLHGMIFAAITETPCIVLNSLSHKVLGCYHWLKDLDYIRIAEHVEDVPGIIEALKCVEPKYNRQKIDEAMQPLYDVLKEIKQGD